MAPTTNTVYVTGQIQDNRLPTGDFKVMDSRGTAWVHHCGATTQQAVTGEVTGWLIGNKIIID